MKQQCSMALIYLSWALYLGGLVFFMARGQYVVVLAWLVGVPLFQWIYLRIFPSISRHMGYGSVADRQAGAVERVPVKATMYSALGCPFCPVVKNRLLALQGEMGFGLEEIDVTLKPGLLTSKGIRSVPVVEVGERRVIGHATSEQLAALIGEVASVSGS